MNLSGADGKGKLKVYTEQEIQAALSTLESFSTALKRFSAEDPKAEKALEIAKHYLQMHNATSWVSAQEELPKTRTAERHIRCNVVLVRNQTNWDFCYAPETYKSEVVYSALFDVEQKLWYIPEEHLYLNALLDPANLAEEHCDYEYVRAWMYLPSAE